MHTRTSTLDMTTATIAMTGLLTAPSVYAQDAVVQIAPIPRRALLF